MEKKIDMGQILFKKDLKLAKEMAKEDDDWM